MSVWVSAGSKQQYLLWERAGLILSLLPAVTQGPLASHIGHGHRENQTKIMFRRRSMAWPK